jgi:predicted DNA-binding transcriptional regulator YafY
VTTATFSFISTTLSLPHRGLPWDDLVGSLTYNGDSKRHLPWESGKSVSRTARLLELLIRVQTNPRFTAQELAEEFGVSRRTILRDMRALSEMGVPLRSTPGLGGGYSLPRGGRRLSPSLTVDEALGLIVSYEAFLRYSASPFGPQNLSAITKLRAALPPDVVGELDNLRRHVAVIDPAREHEAPLLGEVLGAALEGMHLKAVYDSIRSGVSERVIYPFGVYASQGFWYCFCRDYKREENVSLRADRFRAVEPVEGFERPPHVPFSEWVRPLESGKGEMIQVRAYASERGVKSFELESLFGKIGRDSEGRGFIDVEVPGSEIDFYAARLMSAGTEVKVESPTELVELVRQKAEQIAKLYSQDSGSQDHALTGD